MKRSLKIAFVIAMAIYPVNAFSQNWMMAQMYAEAALDSVLNSSSEEAEGFGLCEYSHFKYSAVNQEYYLYLSDYLEDSTYISMITVRLNGGTASFTNDDFQSFDTSVPDWSNCFFLYNNTGKKISFALSCDDSGYSTYSLEENRFERYSCSGSDYMYIKMSTLIDGEEKAQIHYKLLKGKGYKVQWEQASGKFEVYSDDRLK